MRSEYPDAPVMSPTPDQLFADLKLLVGLIPAEVQNDASYYAAQRLYSLINTLTD